MAAMSPYLVLTLAFLGCPSASLLPPQFEASTYTSWSSLKPPNGSTSKVATISIPVDDDDVIKLTRLDLNGDEYQRGFDQGWLLSDSIADFIDKDLNEFFKEEIENLNINSLPVKLQDIIQPLLDKLSEYAPEIFWRSMSFVWESEKDYVPEYLKDEMRGIAEGICSGTTTSKDTCNATEWN